jgi:hypothetical protein
MHVRGSALDTAPYQLRPDVPVTQPQFSQNTFDDLRGPKDSRFYPKTRIATNFQVNYTGNHSSNLLINMRRFRRGRCATAIFPEALSS